MEAETWEAPKRYKGNEPCEAALEKVGRRLERDSSGMVPPSHLVAFTKKGMTDAPHNTTVCRTDFSALLLN